MKRTYDDLHEFREHAWLALVFTAVSLGCAAWLAILLVVQQSWWAVLVCPAVTVLWFIALRVQTIERWADPGGSEIGP